MSLLYGVWASFEAEAACGMPPEEASRNVPGFSSARNTLEIFQARPYIAQNQQHQRSTLSVEIITLFPGWTEMWLHAYNGENANVAISNTKLILRDVRQASNIFQDR